MFDDMKDLEIIPTVNENGVHIQVIHQDYEGTIEFPSELRLIDVVEILDGSAIMLGRKIPGRRSAFARSWANVAEHCHTTAKAKGFWDTERNDGEMIALIHSELSEALEAIRSQNPPDDKLPDFAGVEVELADAVIRIMDMAHARGWRVAQALEAKMKYNMTRPHKHGKEF